MPGHTSCPQSRVSSLYSIDVRFQSCNSVVKTLSAQVSGLEFRLDLKQNVKRMLQTGFNPIQSCLAQLYEDFLSQILPLCNDFGNNCLLFFLGCCIVELQSFLLRERYESVNLGFQVSRKVQAFFQFYSPVNHVFKPEPPCGSKLFLKPGNAFGPVVSLVALDFISGDFAYSGFCSET